MGHAAAPAGHVCTECAPWTQPCKKKNKGQTRAGACSMPRLASQCPPAVAAVEAIVNAGGSMGGCVGAVVAAVVVRTRMVAGVVAGAADNILRMVARPACTARTARAARTAPRGRVRWAWCMACKAPAPLQLPLQTNACRQRCHCSVTTCHTHRPWRKEPALCSKPTPEPTWLAHLRNLVHILFLQGLGLQPARLVAVDVRGGREPGLL